MQKSTAATAICAILLGAVAGSTAQSAENDLSWDFLNDRNYMTLTLRHKDPMAPLPFLAACVERGALKLRIGAPLDKVSKAGEAVSLTLDSAGKRVILSGKAVFNEFTKVHELVLKTTTGHAVFDLLTTGKAVNVASSAMTATVWPAPDTELVSVWRNDCTTRSEH